MKQLSKRLLFSVFGLTLTVWTLSCVSVANKPKAPEAKGRAGSASSDSSASSGSASGASVDGSKVGYHLPEYNQVTLENGLQILFIPQASLPYVSFAMLVKSGASQDPENLSGLASFVADLLDKGTVKRTAPQIAQDLGQMGADFEASTSNDYTMITASGLSMQSDKLLDNFVEIVTQPAFSDGDVNRLRKQISAQVARRLDNPEALATVAFNDFLFGSHPYGRSISGTAKTIDAIKKKNIIQEYKRVFRPNHAILAVVGKYSPDFEKKASEAFSAWQKREIPPVASGAPPAVKGVQLRLVNKPGLVQAQIRIGSIGIRRSNPDFIGIRLANTILGGAFASRLNNRVRKDLGLTYNIGSFFDARLEPGSFEISTFTKNETVGQTITETIKTLKEFREKGVTQAEVDAVKGYLKGIFPTAIETPEKLAMNLLILREYGISDSYLTNYLHDVDKLSTSDINGIIQKYFDDQNLKILVYSSAPAVLSQMEAIGKVEVKDASDYK